MITSQMVHNENNSKKLSGKLAYHVSVGARSRTKLVPFRDDHNYEDEYDPSSDEGFCMNHCIWNRQTDDQFMAGHYGVDKFRCSWDMFLSSPNSLPYHPPYSQHSSSTSGSTRSGGHPSNMVLAVDSVAETVAVVPKPNLTETSVYSQLEISDHRRHKEQVDFRPVLHPVKYADTAYVYINSTKKRFVSRTFYEPRVRPRTFSDTTYTNPKTAEERYVSYLDYGHEKRKWFKTSVEIKAKKFTSAQVLRSANNNYLNTTMSTTTSRSQRSSGFESSRIPNGLSAEDFEASAKGRARGAFRERFDPGASQVFIPKRRPEGLNEQSLVNGDIILNFPNSQVETKGPDLVEDLNIDFTAGDSQVNTEEFSEFSLNFTENEPVVSEEFSEFKFDLSEEVNVSETNEEFAEARFELSETININENNVSEEISEEVRFDLNEEVTINQSDLSEDVMFNLADDVEEEVTVDFSEATFDLSENKVDINMNDADDVNAEATFSLA